jgi:uncharacterized membrane protein YeaQ/YmgE (transglycosylase-associated protein family)
VRLTAAYDCQAQGRRAPDARVHRCSARPWTSGESLPGYSARRGDHRKGILCGIGGIIIGWFIYTAFGGNGSAGIDWVRWIVAIVVAAVLVVAASTITGRNTGGRKSTTV